MKREIVNPLHGKNGVRDQMTKDNGHKIPRTGLFKKIATWIK